MALTLAQKEQLIKYKSEGLTKEQAYARVFMGQKSIPSQPSGRFSDVGEDLKSSYLGVGEDLYGRGQNILEGFKAGQRGEQTAIETGAQMAGNILGGAGDIAFRGVQAAVTPFLKESEERAIEKTATDVFAPVAEKVSEMSPRTQRNIIGGLGLFEGATAGLGGSLTKGVTNRLGNIFKRTPQAAATTLVRSTPEQIFAKTESRLQQIAADPQLSAVEKQAAAEAAMSIRERMAGVTPDIKKRIQEMPPGTLEKYFDQAHLRNVSDTEITPYTMGAQQANDALQKLNDTLRQSGSEIGQTRQKLASVKMPRTSVEKVDDAFINELDKLNLTIRNGEIVTKPGKISKTSSQSDTSTLQDLYKDLQTYKQSPTLANAIDLRMKFDGKIKFGKSAREVSGDVDPVSRSVRSVLAEEAAKVVGRSNAEELARYSDFMEAYADLKSYTDRAAGGEYLLRLVLSGRGGEAQKLVQTVKEYTGVDLMNDATAMKLATEIVGNERQKNLFRQEVTQAGLDAAKLFTGDARGISEVVLRKLADVALDQETIYRAIAAGASGYLLMAYSDQEGVLLPAGVIALSAMPAGARREAMEQAANNGRKLKLSDEIADDVLKSLNMEEPLTKVMNAGGDIDADDVARLSALQTKSQKTALTDEELIEARAIMEKYGDVFPEGKAKSATTKTTDLLEEARKSSDLVRGETILQNNGSEMEFVSKMNTPKGEMFAFRTKGQPEGSFELFPVDEIDELLAKQGDLQMRKTESEKRIVDEKNVAKNAQEQREKNQLVKKEKEANVDSFLNTLPTTEKLNAQKQLKKLVRYNGEVIPVYQQLDIFTSKPGATIKQMTETIGRNKGKKIPVLVAEDGTLLSLDNKGMQLYAEEILKN